MAFRVESKEELLKSLDEARRLIVERESTITPIIKPINNPTDTNIARMIAQTMPKIRNIPENKIP
jgi:hypothetical protein